MIQVTRAYQHAFLIRERRTVMVDDLPALPECQGVMVSSTFTHVKDHRAALIKAIKGEGLTDVAAVRRSIPSTED